MKPLAALTAAMALLLSGCDDGTNAEAQTGSPPPPPVTVATPLVKTVTEWYEFTGRFETTGFVEIRPRVSGYLQSINFADGEIVEQGQVLFVIDPRPYAAAVQEAEAQLTSARAEVEYAVAELERAGQLLGRANISQSTYDERLNVRREADAAVLRAEAELRQAELNLEFTEVRAPFAGRISNRRVDVGNLVTGDPNSTLLTTLVALDPIYLSFDMSESDFLDYQRAALAGELNTTRDNTTVIQARLADEPEGETWPRQGTMNFVDNRVDESSGTIRARAILPNSDYFITPGQFGRLRLPGSPPYEALLIPDSAITNDQASRVVMVVNDDGLVEPRVIRPGPSQPGGLRIVRRGLEPDDRIVINGLMRARPGATVDPQEGTIAPDPDAPQG
ncbi:MAG: efflux RND transporter periplasmic adaptor subunit [Inquilinaceae bacterium]